jgi:hypothetical protein
MFRLIKYREIFTFLYENHNGVVLDYANTASTTLRSLWLVIILILTVANRPTVVSLSSAVVNFHKNAYFEKTLETFTSYFVPFNIECSH